MKKLFVILIIVIFTMISCNSKRTCLFVVNESGKDISAFFTNEKSIELPLSIVNIKSDNRSDMCVMKHTREGWDETINENYIDSCFTFLFLKQIIKKRNGILI